MFDDVSFEIDTAGDNVMRSSRLFYSTSGNIEESLNGSVSKPSQERPSILKQKLKRYHENDKKFIPGKMSYLLRKALGLGMSDVPEHIYRMRHLGYPPGWLKKAEVTVDNISIIGAGSAINSSNNTAVKYDGEKLYEYPGFNTYKNYDRRYDHCHERGFMPIQENTLLENFVTFLSEKRMLGKEATHIKDFFNRNFVNKDLDFNLPNISAPKPVANSTPNNASKKRQSDPNRPKRAKLSVSAEHLTDLSDGEVEDDDDDSVEDCNEGTNQSLTQSMTENGTYLLVPSSAKPNLEQFSEGINDHRLFENLPNVGGTYKKVLDVLKRIQA